jgi:hypothetical protein
VIPGIANMVALVKEASGDDDFDCQGSGVDDSRAMDQGSKLARSVGLPPSWNVSVAASPPPSLSYSFPGVVIGSSLSVDPNSICPECSFVSARKFHH